MPLVATYLIFGDPIEKIDPMTTPPKERHLAIKVRMMPRDTNPHGTIFGGVLLSYIDQAGAIGAEHQFRCNGGTVHPLVTVAMNAVEFHQPVHVGDVVSFWTEIGRIGRTSINVHVTVETDRGEEIVTVTEADVTYVAVEVRDGQRRPVAIQD